MKYVIVALPLLLGPALAMAAEHGEMNHNQMQHGAMNHDMAGHGAKVHDMMDGSGHMMGQGADGGAGAPVQPGQGAFAAIQEIVGILEADPDTDWSKVDIEKLRRHLVDMDNVTVRASVSGEAMAKGMRYTVSGEGAVADSIRRMALAHAETMDGAGGWHFAAAATADGAILIVESDDPEDAAMIRALGFIGAMTRGAHHQSHHLMIARGSAPHE